MPRPKPETPNVQFLTRLPPDLRDRLDAWCAGSKRSRNDVVVEAIARFLADGVGPSPTAVRILAMGAPDSVFVPPLPKLAKIVPMSASGEPLPPARAKQKGAK